MILWGGGVTFVFIMSKKENRKISLKGKNCFFTSATAQTKRVDSKAPKEGRLFGGRGDAHEVGRARWSPLCSAHRREASGKTWMRVLSAARGEGARGGGGQQSGRKFWGRRRGRRNLLSIFTAICSVVSVQPCLPPSTKSSVKLTLLTEAL